MLQKRLSIWLLSAACLLLCSPAALAAQGDVLPEEPLPLFVQAEADQEPSPSGETPEGTVPEIPEEAASGEEDSSYPTLCENVGDLLETETHDAYITGYQGRTFRPDGKITRAETAQLFYALLKEEPKLTASFPDVPDSVWYSVPVRAMASLGAVSGYPSGLFSPGRNITRAEFVSIAARFSALLPGAPGFPDLETAAWAEPAIASAVAHGWISGYRDGTFRPNAFITRAEAVTIVNAMLNRRADPDVQLIHRTVEFSDVSRAHWAYSSISEAATSHGYTRTGSGEAWDFPDRRSGEAWVEEEAGVSYQPEEGVLLTGFQHIGQYTYYFDPETGFLQTGWQVIDGKHYLLPGMDQERRSLPVSQLLTNVNFRAAHRGFDDIDYITVHYTAEPGVSALRECMSFENQYRAASAHFFVDEDGIWRCVMDRDISWHCGNDVYYHDACRNDNSIGIEMCCLKGDPVHADSPYDPDWYFAEETMENTAELVRELMMRYGVPLENVVRHNDVSHKTCPAPFVNDFSAWQAFLDRVGQYKTDYDGSYPARITRSSVSVRSGPGTSYRVVKTLQRNDTVTVLEELGRDNEKNGRWVRTEDGWIFYEYISRK